jgi:hypothetical protein
MDSTNPFSERYARTVQSIFVADIGRRSCRDFADKNARSLQCDRQRQASRKSNGPRDTSSRPLTRVLFRAPVHLSGGRPRIAAAAELRKSQHLSARSRARRFHRHAI